MATPAQSPPDQAGESRWPMALAVLAASALPGVLPAQLRTGDARWLFVLVLVVLLGIIIIGDPGRIDRDSTWLRILTGTLIGLISVVNAAAAARLIAAITTAEHVGPGWYPKYLDYLHLSFTAGTAFSPTDVSAIRPWAKLMMMAQEAISLVVAVLVVARAVNILK